MATAPAAEGSREAAHVAEYEFGSLDLGHVEESRIQSACNGTYAALFGANRERSPSGRRGNGKREACRATKVT